MSSSRRRVRAGINSPYRASEREGGNQLRHRPEDDDGLLGSIFERGVGGACVPGELLDVEPGLLE
jgi:hypothetical protein